MLYFILMTILKILLVLLLMNRVFYPIFSYLVWLYEVKNNAHLEGKTGPVVGTWLLLKAIFTEFAYALYVLALLPFAFRPFSRFLDPPSTKIHHTPILCIHGYAHNQSGWVPFKHRLQKEGYNDVYTLNLFPPFASIRRFADQVAIKAEKIAKETGTEDLIIVGHSMGGLVASYYTEFVAPKGKVKKVIALASPFHGTKTAVFGFGQAVHEMMPGSSLLQSLGRKMKEPKETEYYFVASLLDNIIIPAESALPSRPEKRHLLLNDHGHWGVLFSRRVSRQVLKWVQSS